MSLLDRLNLLIRSEINDLSRGDRLRGAMRDMESSLRDAKRQQIEVRRSEKRLVAQIREQRDKAERWEERAVLALKSGDEELAREALIMKNRSLVESERLREELEQQRAYLEDIDRALEALEMKLDGARGRMRPDRSGAGSSGRRLQDETAWDRELERRMAGQEDGQGTGELDDLRENFGTQRSFREFDRMSSKINEMEADIDAMRELSGDDWADPRRRELEDIFTRMEKKKKSDDDLSDLKKKFSD